jgi:hypothetical protein
MGVLATQVLKAHAEGNEQERIQHETLLTKVFKRKMWVMGLTKPEKKKKMKVTRMNDTQIFRHIFQ